VAAPCGEAACEESAAAMSHDRKKPRRLRPAWRRAKRLSPASTERATAILVDDTGTPMPRPCRRDFTSDIGFIDAYHAWRDLVANTANIAFASAFRKAMRGQRPSRVADKSLGRKKGSYSQ
jgi:hypothetical protein